MNSLFCKKVVILLFAITFCVDVLADADLKVGNYFYYLNEAGEACFRYSGQLEGDIVIPDSVKDNKGNSYPVKKILPKAFYQTKVTSVKLPKNLTVILQFAFEGCVNLKEIEFPESLKIIEIGAFRNSGLKNLVISDNVKSIQKYCFAHCDSLQTVSINCKEVSFESFYKCVSLNKLNIGEDVQSIYTGAFEGCSSIETVVLPESTYYIGDNAFKDCSKLKSVTIKSSAIDYKGTPFYGCNSLAKADFPDHIVPTSLFSGSGYVYSHYSGTWKITGPLGYQFKGNVNMTATLMKNGKYSIKAKFDSNFKVRFRNGSTGPGKLSLNCEITGDWRTNKEGGIIFVNDRANMLGYYYSENGKQMRSDRPDLMYRALREYLYGSAFEYVNNSTFKKGEWVMKKVVKK